MKQYLEVLNKILTEGVEKESGRLNMPNTIGISNATIKMDLNEGFPLLTTKKMFLKGIIHELLWMLRGETNIKYLVDNGVNIWSGDAYRWYLKYCKEYNVEVYFKTQDDFVYFIKNKSEELDPLLRKFQLRAHVNDLLHCGYTVGDLGKVYGYQWRNQNGVDQVRDVIEGLKNNPYSRYHIIDAWNAADCKEQALPPCHLLYQFIVRPLSVDERCKFGLENYHNLIWTDKTLEEYNIPKFYLDLNMYQRSVDSACGLPFNLASMSLLLEIMSKVSNMIPGVATWFGGDTHIYIPHIETVKEQVNRTPYKLPTIKILKNIKTLENIEKLTIEDFELSGYQSHEKINYELFVGLKVNPKKV